MAGNVDDIIDTSQDAVVTIRGKHCAIGSVVRPVAPVLTLRILVVLFVVIADEAVRIAPNRLHDSRPRITNADVARGMVSGDELVSFFVPDDRINSQASRARAT